MVTFSSKQRRKKKPLYLQTLPRYTSTKKSVDRRSENNNTFSFPLPWFLQRWGHILKGHWLPSRRQTGSFFADLQIERVGMKTFYLQFVCDKNSRQMFFFSDVNFLKFYPSDLIPLDTKSIEESKWSVTW